jgi:hypothetical protein
MSLTQLNFRSILQKVSAHSYAILGFKNMVNNVEVTSVACSDCFSDNGLQLDAKEIGREIVGRCPRCGSNLGKKLTSDKLDELAYRFFTWGSIHRFRYGASPSIKYNDQQLTSIELTDALKQDVKIFESILGIGFFYYGPRAWMYGEITPLVELQDPASRQNTIDRIIKEYPTVDITQNDSPFYRVRKAPKQPGKYDEYDSPPDQFVGKGRLDSTNLPALYASPDLEICVHESRVTAEDELYVATLLPTKSLRFLNLAALLKEEQTTTEFESLDLAVSMLFSAGSHAYEITRATGTAARKAGFDGIIYPSFFSSMRNGAMPFQAQIYGISNRRIPQFQEFEERLAVHNLAIFGRPIREGKVIIKGVNKLTLTQVKYNFLFGPVVDVN